MISAIRLFIAPRAATTRCRTSAHPFSSSTARSSASTWPRTRRTLFRSLFFSLTVCDISGLHLYTERDRLYTQGDIVLPFNLADVQRAQGYDRVVASDTLRVMVFSLLTKSGRGVRLDFT